jgi:hypothetical protein
MMAIVLFFQPLHQLVVVVVVRIAEQEEVVALAAVEGITTISGVLELQTKVTLEAERKLMALRIFLVEEAAARQLQVLMAC